MFQVQRLATECCLQSPELERYLEVKTRLFSYRHLYQAPIIKPERRHQPETKSRADVDRGLDIGADMNTAVLPYYLYHTIELV